MKNMNPNTSIFHILFITKLDFVFPKILRRVKLVRLRSRKHNRASEEINVWNSNYCLFPLE